MLFMAERITLTSGSDILVRRAHTRGIPQIMVCRILMFVWPFEPLSLSKIPRMAVVPCPSNIPHNDIGDALGLYVAPLHFISVHAVGR